MRSYLATAAVFAILAALSPGKMAMADAGSGQERITVATPVWASTADATNFAPSRATPASGSGSSRADLKAVRAGTAAALTPEPVRIASTGRKAPDVMPKVPGWESRCDRSGRCQITYDLKNGETLVSQLLIYKVGPRTVLQYTVPLGIDIGKGVVVQIDGAQNFETKLLYCDAPGCVGFMAMDDEAIRIFAAGTQLKLAFVPRRQSDYVAFTYLLKNFDRAMDRFRTASR